MTGPGEYALDGGGDPRLQPGGELATLRPRLARIVLDEPPARRVPISGPWVWRSYEIAVQPDRSEDGVPAAARKVRIDRQGRAWALVDGEVCEPLWGAHYDPGHEPPWTLTHLPTGRAIAAAWTSDELRTVARRLQMLPVPWGSTDPGVLERYSDEVETVPHLAAAAARVVR